MNIKIRFAALGLAAMTTLSAGVANAFPDRPIRLIVPFGAGGITDIVARQVGEAMGDALGQSVVVENRPGAGGVIAAQQGATSDPDGYTLFMGTVGTQIVNPLIRDDLNYDPDTDMRAVGLVSASPYVLAVRSDLGLETYSEFVDYAKENAGELNFGSAGNASSPHLGLELLKLSNGTDILHVPFKSGGEAVNAALGGQVDVVMDAIPVIMPHVDSGKLNALLLASSQSLPAAQGVPTAEEAGNETLQISSWNAFFVPAATPDDVVQTLNAALQETLASEDLRERLGEQGIQVSKGTPEEYDAFIAAEKARWADVVERADIRIE